jgi:PAS domain-containing protein
MEAVARYRLGGLGREPIFDHIAQLASDLFDVPMSVVSIIDADMQCFRGACGLDDDSTSRDLAFCAFTILGDGIMVVPDATLDPRFRTNPMVTGDPFVRFYAGVPLRVGGQAVGTLCLIDRVPRELSDNDRANLVRLARTVVDLIELRVERFEAEEQRRKVNEERELLKLTVENVTEGVALVDGDLRLILWNESFATLFDYDDDVLCEGCEAAMLMRITADRGELQRRRGADPEDQRRALRRAAEVAGAGVLRRASGRSSGSIVVRGRHGERLLQRLLERPGGLRRRDAVAGRLQDRAAGDLGHAGGLDVGVAHSVFGRLFQFEWWLMAMT